MSPVDAVADQIAADVRAMLADAWDAGFVASGYDRNPYRT